MDTKRMRGRRDGGVRKKNWGWRKTEKKQRSTYDGRFIDGVIDRKTGGNQIS